MIDLSSKHSSWKSSFRAFSVILVVAMLNTGCASHVFRAAHLPDEYAAPPLVNLDTINMSRLAATSNANDVICWGDLLKVEIDAGLPSLEPRECEVRVARDGTVKLPLVGRIPVANLEVEKAEIAIASAAQILDVYPNPYVSVRITEPRMNHISVVGAVEKPGTYELPRGASSLMNALVRAEGLSNSSNGDVEIRHTDPRLTTPSLMQAGPMHDGTNGTQLTSHEIPLASPGNVVQVNLLTEATGAGGQYELQDGDVVNVVPRELPPVHVLGLVNKPGAFPMSTKRELRLLDALALAGGCSTQVANRVSIRRLVPGESQPITIEAQIKKAMDGQDNLVLAPGDTVMVRQTPETVVVDIFKSFIRLSVGSSVALF